MRKKVKIGKIVKIICNDHFLVKSPLITNRIVCKFCKKYEKKNIKPKIGTTVCFIHKKGSLSEIVSFL